MVTVDMTGDGPDIPDYDAEIREGEERDPFLARAMGEAEVTNRIHGTPINPDSVRKRAKALRKAYGKRLKDLEDTQAIIQREHALDDREQAIEAREKEVAARDKAHKALLDKIRNAEQKGQPVEGWTDEQARLAVAFVIDGKLDDLIKLRSNEQSLATARAMALGAVGIPMGMFIAGINLFLPDSIKMFVLMPVALVMGLIIVRVMKQMNKELANMGISRNANASNND